MQQGLRKKLRAEIYFSSRATVTICLRLLFSIMGQSFVLYIN